MTSDEAVIMVIDSLDALKIPYLVVGSFATNVYGIPRSTKDADFVLQLGEQSVGAIANRLGPAFRLDPQMSFESVTMTKRHVIHIAETTFTIELFHLSDDPHDQERFHRRCTATMLGRPVPLPTPEDVIITKLRWAIQSQRSKDRDDARDVLAVQGDVLDWDYIHSWCDRHRTRSLLDEIRRSIRLA
jgi:hypothetical protein